MIAAIARRLHGLGRDPERGLALPELLVATAAGLVVMLGVTQMTISSLRQNSSIADRVDANQRGRTTLYQIIDDLHSSCIAPLTIPIRTATSGSWKSTDTSITFTHAVGSAVQPTPTLVNLTLSGTNLIETTYPSTGGTPPNWTFSTTPSLTRTLSTDITQTKVGATTIPMFRYYGYSGGAISGTPFTATSSNPLSATDAAKTVQVVVAFDALPTKQRTTDANAGVSLQNTAFLRLSPPSYDASATNAPCQ